jgi:hypothetical protein
MWRRSGSSISRLRRANRGLDTGIQDAYDPGWKASREPGPHGWNGRPHGGPRRPVQVDGVGAEVGDAVVVPLIKL